VAISSTRANVDSNKRLTAPSPLSKPVIAEPDSQNTSPLTAKASASPKPTTLESTSPAVQQLHAVADKEPTKTVKSRLRRAFSFNSSQELKKASGESTTPAERVKIRKEKADNENDAEEAAIIAKQEAAGLGAGIYSNQGQGLTGSTDNISLSSTASSASLMLRKMGRSMRKSTRSLKGLFRPKSVVGVPTVDDSVSALAASTEVSLVTVEAETHTVNVNADSQGQMDGDVRSSRLERISMERSNRTDTPEKLDSLHEDGETWARRSIFGGDRERAEVLAAVRKGILKRKQFNCWYHVYCNSLEIGSSNGSGTSSPAIGPSDSPVQGDNSNPGTPTEANFVVNREGYFIGAARFASSSTKSLPGMGTNSAPPTLRSISFSPRIQFYDVWSSTEYDRRGDIATCNRLTPMLAQQIKEELNSFKMVGASGLVFTLCPCSHWLTI
jgi:hypothetical protein